MLALGTRLEDTRLLSMIKPSTATLHHPLKRNSNMASALSKPRDYKYIAEKYSQLNKTQVEYGKKLVKVLDLKHGDKVLDMGCGTGEITSFIADQVGEQGQVLGVDPDEERIKVAVQKYSGARRNIKFIAGDSSSHFPHQGRRGSQIGPGK